MLGLSRGTSLLGAGCRVCDHFMYLRSLTVLPWLRHKLCATHLPTTSSLSVVLWLCLAEATA